MDVTARQSDDLFDPAKWKQKCIDAAKALGIDISPDQIEVRCLCPGHEKPDDRPTYLVYIFLLADKALKIGSTILDKTGKRVSDNYNLKKPGTMAYNIFRCNTVKLPDCSQEMKAEIERVQQELDCLEDPKSQKRRMRSWMEAKLGLIILNFDNSLDPKVLEQIEHCFQCNLRPVFENKPSYRNEQRITKKQLDKLYDIGPRVKQDKSVPPIGEH